MEAKKKNESKCCCCLNWTAMIFFFLKEHYCSIGVWFIFSMGEKVSLNKKL